jgi:hypothetical protein
MIGVCCGAPEGTGEADRLDVLTLVEICEAKRWPIEVSTSFDPIDARRYAIAELGHTQAELPKSSAHACALPKFLPAGAH